MFLDTYQISQETWEGTGPQASAGTYQIELPGAGPWNLYLYKAAQDF